MRRAVSNPRPRRRSRRRSWQGAIGPWVIVAFTLGAIWWLAGPTLRDQLRADAAAEPPGEVGGIAATAPPLPDDGGPFAAGSAEQAQHEIRFVAESFADCVFRRRLAARGVGGAVDDEVLPYRRCARGRALGIHSSEIGRRGSHGPIDGKGARDELGIFTVHGGRDAYLLQYDSGGRGWGFSFDAYGHVTPVCRTPKGRECWYEEAQRPGALFLGDGRTSSVLVTVLQQGRASR